MKVLVHRFYPRGGLHYTKHTQKHTHTHSFCPGLLQATVNPRMGSHVPNYTGLNSTVFHRHVNIPGLWKPLSWHYRVKGTSQHRTARLNLTTRPCNAATQVKKTTKKQEQKVSIVGWYRGTTCLADWLEQLLNGLADLLFGRSRVPDNHTHHLHLCRVARQKESSRFPALWRASGSTAAAHKTASGHKSYWLD